MRKYSGFAAVAAFATATLQAGAADLPAKPVYKAPAAVVIQNWSGFYVGANAGYAWGTSDVATEAAGSVRRRISPQQA